MNQNNFVWLGLPLHKNSFPDDVIKHESFDDNFITTLDGSILAVNKESIEKYLDDDSKMIRLGFAKMPKIKVKSIDDLYRYVSYLKFEE